MEVVIVVNINEWCLGCCKKKFSTELGDTITYGSTWIKSNNLLCKGYECIHLQLSGVSRHIELHDKIFFPPRK